VIVGWTDFPAKSPTRKLAPAVATFDSFVGVSVSDGFRDKALKESPGESVFRPRYRKSDSLIPQNYSLFRLAPVEDQRPISGADYVAYRRN